MKDGKVHDVFWDFSGAEEKDRRLSCVEQFRMSPPGGSHFGSHQERLGQG